MINLMLLLLFSFLIGSNYALVKVAQETVTPITLAMMRGLLASGFLLLMVGGVMRRSLTPIFSCARQLALLGMMLGVFFVALDRAEANLSASLSSLLSCVIPISAFFITTLILRWYRFSFLRLTGLWLAVFGVVIFLDLERIQIKREELLSIAILSVGYVFYSLQILYAQALRLDPFVAATGTMVYLSLVLAVAAFFLEQPLDIRPSLQSAVAVAVSGVFCTGLAYLILFTLTQRAGAVFASTSGYLFPIFTIAVGHYLMEVDFNVMQIVGVVVTLLGAWLVNRKPTP